MKRDLLDVSEGEASCVDDGLLPLVGQHMTKPRGAPKGGGVTRPCARARQAKRVLTQGRRGVQGRTGASRDKSLKMT